VMQAQVMRTARWHLSGKLAEARGETDAAAAFYRQGIQTEDAIPYTEPPQWRHPVRESLGALLLRLGQAKEAEAVFRDELKIHPRSARPLFGLYHALAKQGRAEEAAKAEADFKQAWERADVKLTLADL
jgi:tetratricopeptide (TPR) repeat protein